VLRALLFDFDGVIVDTEVATYESWREIFLDHGVDLSLEDWLPAVGSGSSLGTSFDAVDHLQSCLGSKVDREALIKRRAQRKRELCDTAALLPGVRELLEDGTRRSLLTGIVTRSPPEWVRHHLERVGLRHEWDVVACAHEPTASKVDLYRRALELLRVAASESVAFEDSPAGVGAARAAGLRCVAVPNAVTRIAAFEDADWVWHSLAEHRIDVLVERQT